VFVNQTLGESFSLVGHDINSDWLYGRREVYAPDEGFDVPLGGLVLTAGVDVQDDRLEVDVRAWGLYDESWAIDYRVFMGDTSDLGDQHGMNNAGLPTCWKMLDQYLETSWSHECGDSMKVECTAIDSRHHGEEVNLFCRLREQRRIFPIQGKDGWGKGFYLRPKKRHERYHTWNFTLWVDELKNKVKSLLLVDQVGPGYAHFSKKPVYTKEYFKGLTAESIQQKWHMGKQKIYWHCPSGARNEPWDTFVYSYGALHIYSPDMMSRARQMELMGPGGALVGQEARVQSSSRPRRKRGSPGIRPDS
jgi:phage terminase large subunit GpA-like protein